MLQTFNFEQGTQEWLEARAGIITASRMSDVLEKKNGKQDKKTREDYIFDLIGERITGEPSDGFSNRHTERGHALEGEAAELYLEQSGYGAEKVGFFTNYEEFFGEPVGYSPDLCPEEGLAEFKTKLPKLQARVLYEDVIPAEHMDQIQTGLWVTGKPWLDFVSYCPRMPLFIKRAYPDLKKFEEYERAVRQFYQDLRGYMETIRKNAA